MLYEIKQILQGSLSNEMIGNIIIWPTAAWQSDMKAAGGDPDNYLECNGQVVSSSKYPKLAKIMNCTPNYQGIFLRGLGGNSGAIGQVQSDAIRNIQGELGPLQFVQYLFQRQYGALGVNTIFSIFQYGESKYNTLDWASGGSYGSGYFPITFDASKVVPTANENRPINTAVIYLIRAK